MVTIKIRKKKVEDFPIKAGQLYKTNYDVVFLLATLGINKYVLVNLDGTGHWGDIGTLSDMIKMIREDVQEGSLSLVKDANIVVGGEI